MLFGPLCHFGQKKHFFSADSTDCKENKKNDSIVEIKENKSEKINK